MDNAVPDRNRILRWVVDHPLLTMLAWFFTVGQAVAFIPGLLSSPGSRIPEQPFAIASTCLGLLLPTVVLTWLISGRTGVLALLRPIRVVRLPTRWYLVSLGVVPLMSLAIVFAMVGGPDEVSLSDGVRACLVGLAAQTALHLVTNNMWEELAWTGFVQARLQAQRSPMVAALITAPLFALQHSALVFDGSVVGGAVVMAVLIVLAFPFRMVMGWIFNRTRSLFVVGLAHAAGNAVVTSTVLGDALVPGLYGRNFGPVHLFAFAVIGTVVAVMTHGRLGLDDPVRSAAAHDEPARGGVHHGA